MPDITDSLTPKSDQLDAVDLTTGPRDFTITRADYRPGTEQPVTVHLAESVRPWKPGKNMRRVLSACLTTETDNWPGHRVRLYCDGDVVFAGVKVGGIRISHIDIDRPKKVPLILTAGKSVMWLVEPLPTPEDLAEQVVAALADATTEAEVREWGNRAHSRDLLDVQVNGQTVKSHVEHRLAEITQGTEAGADA